MIEFLFCCHFSSYKIIIKFKFPIIHTKKFLIFFVNCIYILHNLLYNDTVIF